MPGNLLNEPSGNCVGNPGDCITGDAADFLPNRWMTHITAKLSIHESKLSASSCR